MNGFGKAVTRSAAIVLILSSTVLNANDARDKEFRIQASETDARRALQTFASCTVDRNRTGARQLALMQPLDPQIQNVSNSIIDKSCLDVRGQAMSLKFRPVSMRYALAEALIHKEMKDYLPASFQVVAGLDHGQVPKIDNAKLPQHAQKRQTALLGYERRFHVWLADTLGECVVRIVPSESRTLLDSRLGSKAEQEAFAAIDRHFAKCRPEGMDVTMDEFDTRGTVAVNYYRLASATLTAAGSSSVKAADEEKAAARGN